MKISSVMGGNSDYRHFAQAGRLSSVFSTSKTVATSSLLSTRLDPLSWTISVGEFNVALTPS